MDEAHAKQIEDDKAKLERAAEPHDWAEELVDSAVGGLISPLEHHENEETASPDAAVEPEKARVERRHDEREAEERLNETW